MAGLERLAHRALLIKVTVGPSIPHDHGPGTVARTDRALEVAVRERVVLDLDSEALLPRVSRRALGHGPRAQHSVHLQAEVVMQGRRGVLLDDEARHQRSSASGRRPPGWPSSPSSRVSKRTPMSGGIGATRWAVGVWRCAPDPSPVSASTTAVAAIASPTAKVLAEPA